MVIMICSYTLKFAEVASMKLQDIESPVSVEYGGENLSEGPGNYKMEHQYTQGNHIWTASPVA